MEAEPGAVISEEAVVGEYTQALREFLRVIRKRLWVIALSGVVLVVAALGYTFAQTPIYEASIKILIGNEGGITQDPSDVQGLQQLTQTIAEAINSDDVAQAVVSEQNLDITPGDILNNLRAEQIKTTQLIAVSYRDSNPQRAQQVANAVGDVFSEQIASPDAGAITATVWKRAQLPSEPVSPSLKRNVALALGIGLLLGVGLAFLLEYFDDSWRSPEEAEQISGYPALGIIPKFEALAGKKGG
jgi:capsular polysaccharide biosynthesis protein